MGARGIIREAKRPPGYEPVGPIPAGHGDDPELYPAADEDLCFLTGEWRIFQKLEGHRWSLDDLVTAWVAMHVGRAQGARRTLDLGCGIGSVLMMVAWALPDARAVGIEAQTVSAGLARRSLRFNDAADRVEVRLGDLRDASILPEAGSFDLVTGTPPYIPLGEGTVSEKVQAGPCRFETRGGVEGYCEAARRALAPQGRFVVINGSDRKERSERAIEAAGLTLEAVLDVVPKAGKDPLFTAWTCRRDDADGTHEVVRHSLMVRDVDGERTEAFNQLRRDMGIPVWPRS